MLALSHAVYGDEDEAGAAGPERDAWSKGKGSRSRRADGDGDGNAAAEAEAEAGIPLTSWRFCCPPGKAVILKAERSVICAGAAQAALAPDGAGVVSVEDGGGG